MSLTEFHPELRSRARLLPKSAIRPLTLPVIRALSRLQLRLPARGVEVLTIADGVGVRLFRPEGATAPGPALLWIHGGGYVMGTAAQDDLLCKRYAARLDATVAAVNYRLAPEHPYPAPVEDCYTALTWLAGLPAVDRRRVAIAGGSAGGGLAAALAFTARDRAEVDVAAQVLIYPMLDDRSSDRARRLDHGFRMWDRRSNVWAWRSFLGDADPQVAVPARRTDLAGLPPAWIGVGSLDLFHDEDLAYAEHLRAAGVPCETHIVPGAFHGFDSLAPKTRVARDFLDSQCDMLRPILAARR
ncbi:MAG: alpha/beta hydrolase [Mycobacterium sp.]